MPELHTVVALRNENMQMTVPFEADIDWTGTGYLADGGYTKYWSVFGETRSVVLEHVTHWMPLPPAPATGEAA